jgi:hypothetical protein
VIYCSSKDSRNLKLFISFQYGLFFIRRAVPLRFLCLDMSEFYSYAAN